MLKMMLVASVAGLLLAGSASAQKLDANGRCHDAKGQFAKAEVCGGASAKAAPTKSAMAKAPAKGAASATAAAAPASAVAKAKSGKCKDAKGKFAKCDAPGAHPA
ncbi:hypothetical protein [Phenylobacterium sp.]|uniref:hypothetical protein n=1 Tax=Phenylobacterium sp. TaxID=1871053 RepID=UPI001226567A|nr:hypothetical protein [Phenylobacterium sp.]THD65035.1 MAG: hypothetical protein E8A49_00550 [Phenylobacterium sp.]